MFLFTTITKSRPITIFRDIYTYSTVPQELFLMNTESLMAVVAREILCHIALRKRYITTYFPHHIVVYVMIFETNLVSILFQSCKNSVRFTTPVYSNPPNAAAVNY